MRSHEEGPPDGSRDRLRGERYELCARGADGSGTWANARPLPPSLNLNAVQFAVLGIPGGEIIP